ncbi:MAG: acyltransferase [Rickettsiales bacterium]|nr:acyltransferase [Rickettsiales bacterium]
MITRAVWLDQLRALAMCGIVLMHVLASSAVFHASWATTLFMLDSFTRIAIPLFWLISGWNSYCFPLPYRKRLSRIGWRLGWLVLASIVYNLFPWGVPKLALPAHNTLWEMLSPWYYHLWFLHLWICFSLAQPLIGRVATRIGHVRLTALLLLWYGLCLYYLLANPKALMELMAHQFLGINAHLWLVSLLYYMLGLALAANPWRIYHKRQTDLAHHSIGIALLCCVLGVYGLIAFFEYTTHPFFYWSEFTCVLYGLAAYLLLYRGYYYSLQPTNPQRLDPLAIAIASASFTIYLWHPLLRDILDHWMPYPIETYGLTTALIIAVIYMAILLAGLVSLHRILRIFYKKLSTLTLI